MLIAFAIMLQAASPIWESECGRPGTAEIRRCPTRDDEPAPVPNKINPFCPYLPEGSDCRRTMDTIAYIYTDANTGEQFWVSNDGTWVVPRSKPIVNHGPFVSRSARTK